MNCCNPGYCCGLANLTAAPPSTITGAPPVTLCKVGSFFNTLSADTVGVVWRAATGTVDPWTKNELVAQNATDLVNASGGTLSASDALAQAQKIATDNLSQNTSCPSQAVCGFQRSFKNIPTKIKDLLTGVSYMPACDCKPCSVFPQLETWVVVVFIALVILLIAYGYARR